MDVLIIEKREEFIRILVVEKIASGMQQDEPNTGRPAVYCSMLMPFCRWEIRVAMV